MSTKQVARRARRAAGGAFPASAVALGTAGPATAAGESVTVTPDWKLPDTRPSTSPGQASTRTTNVEVYQCVDDHPVERCSVQAIGSAITNAGGGFGPTTATVRAVFETDSE